MIFFNIWSAFQWYLRPFVKWFLRKTTRLCELQRICYGEPEGATRIIGVEKSLSFSRTKEVKELTMYLDSVILERRFVPTNFDIILDPITSVIIKVKLINPKIHSQFIVSFRKCLERIWCYKQLLFELEDLRKTQFDCNNLEHERKLILLWSTLMPNEPLESRITKQWQDIGFQGDDPKTDFRGMGLLGLENLLFFASEYPRAASHVLSHARHPKYGYAFAIVGINLTSLAFLFLKNGLGKAYMYNAKHYLPDVNQFHRFYCYLFYEFDKLWIESKPQNMMEFSVIYHKFENFVRCQLADPASVFRINLEVDTV